MSPDPWPPRVVPIAREELAWFHERIRFWRTAAIGFAIAALLELAALLTR